MRLFLRMVREYYWPDIRTIELVRMKFKDPGKLWCTVVIEGKAWQFQLPTNKPFVFTFEGDSEE